MRLWVTSEGALVALLHLRAYQTFPQLLLTTVYEDCEGQQRGPDDDNDNRGGRAPSCRNLQQFMTYMTSHNQLHDTESRPLDDTSTHHEGCYCCSYYELSARGPVKGWKWEWQQENRTSRRDLKVRKKRVLLAHGLFLYQSRSDAHRLRFQQSSPV